MRSDSTSSHASSGQDREVFEDLVQPVVAEAGFDLDDLAVSQAGRRKVVKVVVDGDGGVSLDDIAKVSRAISAVLDERDGAIGDVPYTLEVTSPGVDRPLMSPRHWQRAVNRLVVASVEEKSVEGRVVAVDGDLVTLDVDGTAQSYTVNALSPGKVQVEFAKAPKQPKPPRVPKEPKKQKKSKGSEG